MNISKDLIILLLIALLIFGPSRVSELGGALGKMVRDFRKAMEDPEGGAAKPQSSETTPH